MSMRRLLAWLGVTLVTANVLSSIWEVNDGRAHAEQRLRDFDNVAFLLAQETARSLELIAVALTEVAADISATGVGDRATRRRRISDRVMGLPQARTVMVLDRDGIVLLSTSAPTPIGADFSRRPYFVRHRDGSAASRYVSEPFRDVVTKQWVYAVSDRFTDAGGNFAGAVVALVDIDRLDRLYGSLDLGPGGFVALMSLDGTLVTRAPQLEGWTGKKLVDHTAALESVAKGASFHGWSPSQIPDTGGRVLVAVIGVANSPLVYCVGSSDRAIFAAWRTEAWRVAVRTLLVSIVMLALVWLAALELRRREEADRRAQENEKRLQQARKMEAVGRLAGGIAHDFNSALGGIQGYGEMLLENAAEGSADQRYARNILTAANRARALVEQILTYSRTQKVSRGPVDINRSVRHSLDTLRDSFPPGVVLHAQIPAEPLVVIANASQIDQIVTNLCTNAIHAMDDKGELTVSIAPMHIQRETALDPDTLAPGRHVRLRVSDTGSGMDEATRSRIFEPFFTTKEVGRGTGLGLSVVYGIVADSGGAMHVQSQAGVGTTFDIYFPRSEWLDIRSGDVAEASQIHNGNAPVA
jgi:signal transduction histidine kinase